MMIGEKSEGIELKHFMPPISNDEPDEKTPQTPQETIAVWKSFAARFRAK